MCLLPFGDWGETAALCMMGHDAMSGAVELTRPSHLLAKLAHEAAVFGANLNNSYAAINALRDAYHLREWMWQDRLHPTPPFAGPNHGKGWRRGPMGFMDQPRVL